MKSIERYTKPSKSSRSIMTFHSLLALLFAMSCLDFPSCNGGGDITSVPAYPPRILSPTRQECPSDDQRETIRAEVEEDLRGILRHYLGKTCIIHKPTVCVKNK